MEGVDPTPKPLLDTTASHGTVNTHSVHNTPCYFSVSLKKKVLDQANPLVWGIHETKPLLGALMQLNKQHDVLNISIWGFFCFVSFFPQQVLHVHDLVRVTADYIQLNCTLRAC